MIERYDRQGSNEVWSVVLLAAFLLLPWLGETWFNSKGEPREAIVAVSMLNSGNWVLPLSSGGDMPFKPPLMAWLIAAFSWLFNGGVVNEYLSRLPSALAAIAMIACGYNWARKVRGSEFAFVFSLVTLTCFEVFRAAMACRLDMVLTACMVISLYLLYDLRENRKCARVWRWLCVWFLLSCAVLTKGPVGALLPCFIAGAFYVFRGSNFIVTFFKMIGLAAAAMLIPALWYYEAWLQGGSDFLSLMLEENLGRLSGTMTYESHQQPFYYNFLTLAAGTLPWILCCLIAAFSRRRNFSALKPAGMMALTVVVLTILFYSIPASKRSVYLLPAYPFVCYCITSVICSSAAQWATRAFAWIMSGLAVAAVIVFIVISVHTPEGLTLAHAHWYGYAMLAAPLLAVALWVWQRCNPARNTAIIVWSMYLMYIACIMPAVLNPRSDKNCLPAINSAGAEAPLLLTPTQAPDYRLFTLNFYYRDGIRPITQAEQLATLPAGTKIIVPDTADSTLLGDDYSLTLLTRRGCDFRHPLRMAVKKECTTLQCDTLPATETNSQLSTTNK